MPHPKGIMIGFHTATPSTAPPPFAFKIRAAAHTQSQYYGGTIPEIAGQFNNKVSSASRPGLQDQRFLFSFLQRTADLRTGALSFLVSLDRRWLRELPEQDLCHL